MRGTCCLMESRRRKVSGSVLFLAIFAQLRAIAGGQARGIGGNDVLEVAGVRRFVVFKGDRYYPSSGVEDFDNSFDTEEECFVRLNQLAEERNCDWVQFWDTLEHKVYMKYFKTGWREEKVIEWMPFAEYMEDWW